MPSAPPPTGCCAGATRCTRESAWDPWCRQPRPAGCGTCSTAPWHTGPRPTEIGRRDDATDPDRGHYLPPSLVLGAGDSDPLVAEEQFGPVLPLLRFDTEEEAVVRANSGELGLGASVWSADEDRAFDLARRLDAGFTFVNTHNRTGLSLRAPFGGVKRSGWGREYGDEGVLEHVQTCVVHAPGAFRPGGAGLGAAAYPTG